MNKEQLKEFIDKYEVELINLNNKYKMLKQKQDQSKRKSTRLTEEIRWLLAYISGIEKVINDLKEMRYSI